MNRMQVWHRIVWVGLFSFLVLAPFIMIFGGSTPPAREWWRELSVGMAFAGLAIMGFQFALTARLPWISDAFPLDRLYQVHHQISLLAFFLMMAHPLLLFAGNSRLLGLLNVLDAPWRARAAVTATAILILLVVSSRWRKRLAIPYERWRLIHGGFAIAAVTLSLLHALGVGYYITGPGKRELWILYSCIWIGLLCYVRLIKPWIMLRHPFRVVAINSERGNAWSLTVEPDGHRGLQFLPGQFAWLTVWNSPYRIREHPFSISSSAKQPKALTFTIKDLGNFTTTVKTIPIDHRIYLDGPYGSFSLDLHVAPGYCFIAGGIGITPIMSMLRTCRDRTEQRIPLILFYGNKNWEEITFREEIDALRASLNLTVIHVLENPPERWQGESGFITRNLLKRYLTPDRKEWAFFICGPTPLMNTAEQALRSFGIHRKHIHSERFDLV